MPPRPVMMMNLRRVPNMADWPYSTARWQRLRLAHLDLEPACRGCHQMGLVTRADTVDHVIAISDGGNPFPGHDGLASYCTPCHGRKTARGTEAGAARTSKPTRGCDANGWPLDPAPHWNRGKSLRAEAQGPAMGRNPQLVSKGNRNG